MMLQAIFLFAFEVYKSKLPNKYDVKDLLIGDEK